jgi:hypothetical protein
MPALLTYIVAIVFLLGGGYVGLQWLAEPAAVTSHAGKDSLKSRKVAEQARPFADVGERHTYEQGSVPTVGQSKSATEAIADPQATGGLSNTMQARPEKDPPKDVADVPRGGCMPFGITESGELVFPMECQAILAQYGAGRIAPDADPPDPTPRAKPAAGGDR